MKAWKTARICIRNLTSATDEKLKQQLKEQLKLAMKNKEKQKVLVVKSVLSDILNAEKSGLASLPSVSQLIQRGIKKRKDAIQSYVDGGRQDLASGEQSEITILETFLPKQLSDGDVVSIIKQVMEREGIAPGNGKELGKLMKLLTAEPELDAAVAPRKLVSDLAKKVLAG
ncbi:hypothetical protein HDV03_003335 [Kappamyces sp. JEL0829]|nr:hypothetical protein HDV03_003335 [Kappamyces sp. JEL0829]